MHGQRSWLSSLRPLRARALKRVNGSERRCFLWACFFPPQLLPPLASLTRNKRERWRKASKVEQESASGELYRPAERQTLSAHTDDSSFSLSLPLSLSCSHLCFPLRALSHDSFRLFLPALPTSFTCVFSSLARNRATPMGARAVHERKRKREGELSRPPENFVRISLRDGKGWDQNVRKRRETYGLTSHVHFPCVWWMNEFLWYVQCVFSRV